MVKYLFEFFVLATILILNRPPLKKRDKIEDIKLIYTVSCILINIMIIFFMLFSYLFSEEYHDFFVTLDCFFCKLRLLLELIRYPMYNAMP